MSWHLIAHSSKVFHVSSETARATLEQRSSARDRYLHAHVLGDARFGISLQLWATAARMVMACAHGAASEDLDEDL